MTVYKKPILLTYKLYHVLFEMSIPYSQNLLKNQRKSMVCVYKIYVVCLFSICYIQTINISSYIFYHLIQFITQLVIFYKSCRWHLEQSLYSKFLSISLFSKCSRCLKLRFTVLLYNCTTTKWAVIVFASFLFCNNHVMNRVFACNAI